ncbi:MAG: hypothetical protein HY592_01090 [Candidatus Omnitrophica bacterium]|nr:hypothetical protein [Candidatus Omnitrophota bacterium]
MKAVVLSNQSQYRKFEQATLGRLDAWKIYCDNERFYGFFKAKGIAFEVLDEFSLKDLWADINTWGCLVTGRWVRLSQERRIFPDVNLISVIRLFFSYTLIPAVKNYYYAQRIVEKERPEEVLIFISSAKRDYPFFSGNAHLNTFLKARCVSAGIPFQEIIAEEEGAGEHVMPFQDKSFKSRIAKWVKKAMEVFCRFCMKPGRRPLVLVHGSLRHLAPVLEGLKSRRVPAAIYDFAFHREQFLFAARKGMPYLLPSSGNFSKTVENQLAAAFEAARAESLFVYQGYDFSDFVRDEILPTTRTYWGRLEGEQMFYERLLKDFFIGAVVLDEDYALRGSFLAAFMRKKGVPIFCVSHANLAVSFAVPAEGMTFNHSTTLVHSDFEKDMYAARGWNPEGIQVTGTPRYDRLIRMLEEKSGNPPPKNERLQLLFCATGLWLHSPDQQGYLGNHNICFGGIQIPVIRAIFQAIEGLPVDLIIKPHSYESIPLWKSFLEKESPGKHVTLAKHSDDFFKILLESDAMLVAYWSTAMIESAIGKVPTFFVALPPFQSDILNRYAQDGYCKVVSSAESLRSELTWLAREGRDQYQSRFSRRNPGYYLGLNDGKASDRAVRFVEKAFEVSV